ncbi:perlucin-like [Strongylocentrotus purpuratus]|uniref:C-type lectin domain-containing protein n=1 Tax=Strongylocentrotus purpuratus TaxID=7668 RepID=A0A7M7NZR1_STRPU|nr:perlucin-like [Strongylocentrotus purpuratus]
MENLCIKLCLLLLTSITTQQYVWRDHRLPEDTECPTGFQRRGQVCYHISSTATVSRDDARSRCAGLNSRLIEITSSEKDAVIRSLALAENKTHNYWIGLEQRNHTLRWMDGSPLNLTVWSIRQTQRDTVISDCVRTIPPWNHWHETNCNHTSQFLCEGKIAGR